MFDYDRRLNSNSDYIRFTEGPEPRCEYSDEEENRDMEQYFEKKYKEQPHADNEEGDK